MRFLIILLLLPLADITGTVVGVADGDTISVLDGSKGLTKVRRGTARVCTKYPSEPIDTPNQGA